MLVLLQLLDRAHLVEGLWRLMRIVNLVAAIVQLQLFLELLVGLALRSFVVVVFGGGKAKLCKVQVERSLVGRVGLEVFRSVHRRSLTVLTEEVCCSLLLLQITLIIEGRPEL